MRALLLFCVLLGQAHAHWQSLYYRDHPLVGKIFSTESQQWLTESQMLQALRKNPILLLGETHTNPDHHIAQARVIRQWMSRETPVMLVFEMLTYEDWAKQSLQPNVTLDALTAQLEQISGRWQWELYQPLLELHVQQQLPMVGANLTTAQLKDFSAGDSCELARNGLSIDVCKVLNEQQQLSIQQLIYDAHCEYLPLESTPPMMRAQAAKDASFALTLADNIPTNSLALIAGAVHVRKDIGVPVHLRKLGVSPDASIASLAFINVQPAKLTIEEYFEGTDPAQQFDYIVFTPSERNQDPCEEFAAQLKKMQHKK